MCCCVVTDLAEVRLCEPGEDDGEQPQEEGEDGGEEEAPPLPLHQTLLVVDQRNALATACFTTLHTLGALVLLTSGAKVSILSPIFIVKDVCIPHLATSDVVSEIRKMQKWHNIHFSQDCLGLWAAFCIVRLSILLLCCDVQCWQGAISLVPCPPDQVLPLCPAVIMPWCLNAGCCVPFNTSLLHHYVTSIRVTIPITADCRGQDREHLSCPHRAQRSLNTGTHCIALQPAQQGESKQARSNKGKRISNRILLVAGAGCLIYG